MPDRKNDETIETDRQTDRQNDEWKKTLKIDGLPDTQNDGHRDVDKQEEKMTMSSPDDNYSIFKKKKC